VPFCATAVSILLPENTMVLAAGQNDLHNSAGEVPA
jgi:hypothetical protein